MLETLLVLLQIMFSHYVLQVRIFGIHDWQSMREALAELGSELQLLVAGDAASLGLPRSRGSCELAMFVLVRIEVRLSLMLLTGRRLVEGAAVLTLDCRRRVRLHDHICVGPYFLRHRLLLLEEGVYIFRHTASGL